MAVPPIVARVAFADWSHTNYGNAGSSALIIRYISHY